MLIGRNDFNLTIVIYFFRLKRIFWICYIAVQIFRITEMLTEYLTANRLQQEHHTVELALFTYCAIFFDS